MADIATESDATRVRRELLDAYKSLNVIRAKYFPAARENGNPTATVAYPNAVEAASYSYMLAAVIRVVGEKFGPEAADEIARLVDSEADDYLNDDLLPEEPDHA